MRVNNNDNNNNRIVHDDLIHRYSRTAQALKPKRTHGGFMSDLEAAIDRDTVKTPDPLFAGAAQRYEQAERTMSYGSALRYDRAIIAPAQTEYTYRGRDAVLESASRYMQLNAQVQEKPDPLIASLLAKYERSGTISDSDRRDPAIISPA